MPWLLDAHEVRASRKAKKKEAALDSITPITLVRAQREPTVKTEPLHMVLVRAFDLRFPRANLPARIDLVSVLDLIEKEPVEQKRGIDAGTMICRHCLTPFNCRTGRGLCRTCWNDPAIKERYKPLANFGGRAAWRLRKKVTAPATDSSAPVCLPEHAAAPSSGSDAAPHP